METSYRANIRNLTEQGKIIYASKAEESSFGPPDAYAHFEKPNSPSDGIDVCNTNRLHPLFKNFCNAYGHLITGNVSDWGPGAGVETSELADACPNAERIVVVTGTPFDSERLLQMSYTEIRSAVDRTLLPDSLADEVKNQLGESAFNLDTLLSIQSSCGCQFFRCCTGAERRIEEWIGNADRVVAELFERRNTDMKLNLQYDNVGAQYYWMLELLRQPASAKAGIDFVLNRMSPGGCLFWGQIPPGIDPSDFKNQDSETIVIPSGGALLVARAGGEIGSDLLRRGFKVGMNEGLNIKL